MTKKELLEDLKDWPEDTEIEIAIAKNVHAAEPVMESDKYWLEIFMVEMPNPDPKDTNKHCLLFGGAITMG